MLAQGKGGIGDEREPALDRRRGQAAGPDLLEIAGGEGTPCGPHGSHRARPGDQHGRVCLDAGVGSFLRSRGIIVDWGNPNDPAGRETICGLGNRKNELFNEVVRVRDVEVFESSVALVQKLRTRCVLHGLVS